MTLVILLQHFINFHHTIAIQTFHGETKYSNLHK